MPSELVDSSPDSEVNMRFSRILTAVSAIVLTALCVGGVAMAATPDTTTLSVGLSPATVSAGDT
ncbi:hypothetical protein [Gandjariella thermophila]|nr:hypothetical protein [Gandjariella thermophila]